MPVLLFTSKNTASSGIARALIAEHGFEKKSGKEWEREGVRLIETGAPSVLDVPTGFDTDYILVLSSHKSRAGGKMLTAHFPGNWNDAAFGGEPRTLNIACASRLKILMQEMQKANKELQWPLFMEADHHGPTIDVPIMFVEVGSTEAEWADEKALSVVARAVSESLKRDGSFETALGVGGGHYSREFTRLVLDTGLAVGHIAPKYALDALDEGIFRQAVERNVEKVTKVVVLKDGASAKQKERIKDLAGSSGIRYEQIDM
ncbi:MAG: D-aminoacyl-tRNA deacylase [Candidatus Micrarchaeota archaeon]